MRVAITGANGFVGSNLCRYLASQDHQVTGLVRRKANIDLLDSDIMIQEVDYNDSNSLKDALIDAEVVIHTAAMTKALSWQEIYKANVQVTALLCQVVNSISSIKQFIFISSQAAGGFADREKVKTESDLSHPMTWYGKSKLYSEFVIKNNIRSSWTIIRPCSVFGGGDRDFFEYFRLQKRGLTISIDSGEKKIDLIYIEDLCKMISMTIDNRKAWNEIFYVSDGAEHTLKELQIAVKKAVENNSINIRVSDKVMNYVGKIGDIVGAIIKKPIVINSQKVKEMQIDNWHCSINKAHEILGFTPQSDLQVNIIKTYQWYREHHWL